MLCGGRTQYGPLARLSVPHLALSSLPSAYHPPRFCRRIVAFFSGFWWLFSPVLLFAFASSWLRRLVIGDCIIDRNSESSSDSSPLPPPCAGARDRGSERRGGVRPIDGQLAGGRQVEDGTALGWK